jgi:uncharacterized phiE125 gp8 family phage protein
MRLISLTRSDPADIVSDAANHARIESTADEGPVIEALVSSAVEYIEGETRQQLFTARYRMHLDGFPDAREIGLPKPPMQSVQAVKYLSSGVEQTLAPGAYTVAPSGSKPGYVALNPGQSWPATDDVPGSVRVDFTAGYGDESVQLPSLLRQAVLLTFAHYYANREATTDRRTDELPLAVRSIVNLNQFPHAV